MQASGIQPDTHDCCARAVDIATKSFHMEVVLFLSSKVVDKFIRDQLFSVWVEFAAQKNHVEAVVYLLQCISDLRLKDKCCMIAVESAASARHFDVVRVLIQSIEDRCLRDQIGRRTMESAVRSGHLDVVAEVLANINDQNVRDQCCVDLVETAASAENWDVAKYLVQTIVDQDIKDQCCMKFSESAAMRDNWDIVKFLLQLISNQSVKDQGCMKLAGVAATRGDLNCVTSMVQSIASETVRYQYSVKAAESATMLGHFEVATALVQAVGESVRLKDQSYSEIAESAAQNGKLEIVKFCVQSISDPKIKDQCCAKMAEYAAALSDLEVTKLLVMCIEDQTIRDICCAKVVDSAAKLGHGKAVMFFLQIFLDQNLKDQCCAKSAESAARNNHWDLFKLLILHIADASMKDQCCKKVTILVASKGQLELMKYILQAFVDPHVRDECCILAARSAAENEHVEVVRCLLHTISDKDIKDNCCLDLINFATQSRKVNVLEAIEIQPQLLLSNIFLTKFLSDSAIQGSYSTLQKILPQMQPHQVTQLLCQCISAGHVALALTLLPNVSEVDLPDSTGATALMLAADAGQHELVAQLLDLGASVRAEDSMGRTALLRACQAGHIRAAKTLADRGADVSHRDHQGLTCVQQAEKFGHTSLCQLFQWDLFQSGTQGSSSSSMSVVSLIPEIADVDRDRKLSVDLHHLLNLAGFSRHRAQCQQAMANLLQGIARTLTREDMQMTGSYAEGWANSLVQVNGRTAADSDIDWTFLMTGQIFHLEGGCEGKRSECKVAVKLNVINGHAQVSFRSGSQPAVAAMACGVRPAQDTCHAISCCSFFGRNSFAKRNSNVHLVRATRPNYSNELRISYGFHEKEIMRKITGVQGQLFTILKFIFKRCLPYQATHGLKTYHAKTLLLFMLEKITTVWKPQNLIALLKESLDMMLSFINSSSSPDECMPHFFMPDAPLYFKNAGIGGHFDNTKARVRDRLSDLRSDIGEVVEQIRGHVRPLQSENFYFHPFTVLPMIIPPVVTEVREGSVWENHYDNFADAYCLVNQCLTELQSELCDRDSLMRQLSLLQQLQWCMCAAQCMTAMAHLKFGDMAQAERLVRDLCGHSVMNGWSPDGIANKKYDKQFGHWYWDCPLDTDWAWRFCFPCITQPHFPFLPEFTQTLLTARLSQPRSSHLYVNFRCLSWSLQAELLRNHTAAVSAWKQELEEDPDLEELLTLAHYSDCREHLQFCLRHMETVRDERRVAMETQDEEKIEWVRAKLRFVAVQDHRTRKAEWVSDKLLRFFIPT